MRIKIFIEIGEDQVEFEFRVGGVDLGLLNSNPERFYHDYIEPTGVMATNGLAEKRRARN